MATKEVRLAMWSGPRNISTAMMRAFENRSDSSVMDEPFYAAYLHDTGLDHPMRSEILDAHETDWQKVVAQCLAPLTEGCSVSYQKHMTHHMLPKYDRDWLEPLHHCFLIRDPARVLASYKLKRAEVTLQDIGLPQQLELFEWVQHHGEHQPVVIDSSDFLQAPKAYLEFICAHVGIEFSNKMLQWPAGLRDSDGVWASHWYNQVRQSTSFQKPAATSPKLSDDLLDLHHQAEEVYQHLFTHRVRIG